MYLYLLNEYYHRMTVGSTVAQYIEKAPGGNARQHFPLPNKTVSIYIKMLKFKKNNNCEKNLLLSQCSPRNASWDLSCSPDSSWIRSITIRVRVNFHVTIFS